MAELRDDNVNNILWWYFAVVGLVLVIVVALGMNVGDDDSNPVATVGGDETSEVTPEQIAAGQEALTAVGCYSGPIDGLYGGATDQAILDFQAASGLEVDGVFGPATLEALENALASGQTVCATVSGGGSGSEGDGSGGTDPGDGGDGSEGEGEGETDPDESDSRSATLQSTSYSKTFTVTNWDCTGEAGDLALQGEADGSTLVVAAIDGAGPLDVDGGTEQDGITLTGQITSVSKTPGNFTAGGAFSEPNLVGEEFSLTGTC